MENKKSKATVPQFKPRLMTRRASLIEEYYTWRSNEFEAALVDAALKEQRHKTPPPSPVYERRHAKIECKSYDRLVQQQRKKDATTLAEDVGYQELDIFKAPKAKKFIMYPVVPHTPDETPHMTPNLSSASLASSGGHHHHTSFPHLPNIDENSESEADDLASKPLTFSVPAAPSKEATKQERKMSIIMGLDRQVEQRLLQMHMERKVSGAAGKEKRLEANDVDLERNQMNVAKYSKWELVQEFIPWIMVLTSILQIWSFILDNDDFFRLLVFAPTRMNELWRFATYIFLHTNFTHLALNVAIQIVLAIPLEFEQSHGRVAVVYFGGAIFGSIGASLIGPRILIVGASAGVYSLLTSHIPHTILNRNTIRFRTYRLVIVAALCVSDFVYMLYHINSNGNSEPVVGIWAHVFGALGGLVLGTIFYTFIVPDDSIMANHPRHYREFRLGSIAILIGLVIFATVYNLIVSA